jgi:hypothetical protein
MSGYYDWFQKIGLNPFLIPSTDYKLYSVFRLETKNKKLELTGTLNQYFNTGNDTLPQSTLAEAVLPTGSTEIRTSLSGSINWLNGLLGGLFGNPISGNASAKYSGDAIANVDLGDVYHERVLDNDLTIALDNCKICHNTSLAADISSNGTIFAIVDLYKTKKMILSVYDKKDVNAKVDVDAVIAKGSVELDRLYEKKSEQKWDKDEFLPFACKLKNVMYEHGKFTLAHNTPSVPTLSLGLAKGANRVVSYAQNYATIAEDALLKASK